MDTRLILGLVCDIPTLERNETRLNVLKTSLPSNYLLWKQISLTVPAQLVTIFYGRMLEKSVGAIHWTHTKFGRFLAQLVAHFRYTCMNNVLKWFLFCFRFRRILHPGDCYLCVGGSWCSYRYCHYCVVGV